MTDSMLYKIVKMTSPPKGTVWEFQENSGQNLGQELWAARKAARSKLPASRPAAAERPAARQKVSEETNPNLGSRSLFFVPDVANGSLFPRFSWNSHLPPAIF